MTQTLRPMSSFARTILVVLVSCAGCASKSQIDRLYESPYPGQWNLAVAPLLNHSGSDAVDVILVTDELYAELQQVKGSLQIIPVNRVMAAMYELGMEKVNNPTDALTLAEALGVDGIIVGSITEYDPYYPPRMGLAIQLYTREGPSSGPANEPMDPGTLARAGRPFELNRVEELTPQISIVRIFDTTKNEVQKQLKSYAKHRSDELEPYGWKKWTTRQNYPRFVAHEIIGEMLAIEAKLLVEKPQGE
jgi:hypothetical protein